MPKSIRFEYINTSKPIIGGNQEMTGLCVIENPVVDESREKLQAIIQETQNRKVKIMKDTPKKYLH